MDSLTTTIEYPSLQIGFYISQVDNTSANSSSIVCINKLVNDNDNNE